MLFSRGGYDLLAVESKPALLFQVVGELMIGLSLLEDDALAERTNVSRVHVSACWLHQLCSWIRSTYHTNHTPLNRRTPDSHARDFELGSTDLKTL